MPRILKFLALSAPDKLLLLHSVLIVAAIRLGLSLLSYRALRLWMPNHPAARLANEEELRRIARSVRNAARLVPGATCLTQALGAQFLLARAGYRSQIQIGVAKDAEGEFLAHAWLISSGRVVIGGSSQELQRYTLLADLDLGSS